MTTHDAFLAAIIAKPDDDLPRLVYADWLEENGQSDRAEFIRVQCELPAAVATLNTLRNSDRDHIREQTRVIQLRTRERELFTRHACEWFGDRWSILCHGRPEEDATASLPEQGHYFVSRGFVFEARCTLSEWYGDTCRRCLGSSWAIAAWDGGREKCSSCKSTGRTTGIGPGLVRSHPIQRVTITDREPLSGGEWSGWLWFGDCSRFGPQPLHPESDLPQPIRDMLTTSEGLAQYPTRDAAESALSAALLKWAKAQPTAGTDE